MPAEWEKHDATWLGWPHNKSDWPGKFDTIRWVYGEIIRKLSPAEVIRIIINSKEHEQSARRVLTRSGVDLSRVEFFRLPTDRGWTRDFGPMFVRREERQPEVAINNFRFTGWAKYDNWKKDAKIHERVAGALRLRLFHPQVNGKPFVLEGGAIDVNGCGTLLTTEECLLDQETQVRNPGLNREDTERALRDAFGVTNIMWLGRGIAGDDTHGHIDDLARFINPRTIVLCNEKNPSDVNYLATKENRERLDGMHLEDGLKPEVVALPMPAPLVFDGVRLPASYANFYIGNAAVLVPTFNDPNDRIALGILSELITDRPVVGIHAVDLVWGLGTLHCLTQQQPTLARTE
ncbi:MAG: agmatine deiminase family protein [Ignavibacteria bacterium]|nr:agmatine deiminase family protein [Ignavibacteria bacterium]